MNISEHITFEEATHTKSGLPNIPDNAAMSNMVYVAVNLFEPLRAHFGVPIMVNSFFRSKEVNRHVGGVPTSQHVTGCAMDLACKTVSVQDMFDFVFHNLTYDQIIHEGTWLHVSLKKSNNRFQSLRKTKAGYESYPA